MIYTQHYESPLGGILLAADDTGLTGLWFEGQKYFARTLDAVHQEQETAVLSEARRWLDVYFGGQEPDFTPPLHPAGSAFQQEVWALLRRIPCGQTTTYGCTGKAAGCRARPFPNVCAGCGRGCRTQCDLHHHSLPPRCRNKRQPDRICRRHR